jgi:hypothetical protein
MRPSCGGCFSEKLIVILQDGYLIQAYLEMETANFSEVLASQLTLKRCHHPDMEMQVWRNHRQKVSPINVFYHQPQILGQVWPVATDNKVYKGKSKGKVVPVLFFPFFNWAPRREGVLGEWTYSSTHSWHLH